LPLSKGRAVAPDSADPNSLNNPGNAFLDLDRAGPAPASFDAAPA